MEHHYKKSGQAPEYQLFDQTKILKAVESTHDSVLNELCSSVSSLGLGDIFAFYIIRVTEGSSLIY